MNVTDFIWLLENYRISNVFTASNCYSISKLFSSFESNNI